MAAAALVFTVMVALVKTARAELSAYELIFWRSLISVPVAWWFARSSLFIHNRPLLVARCVLGFGAMVGFFTAAKGLPLTTLSLISKLQPILIVFLAPVLLGASERIDATSRAAIGVGLAGCALIIGPELSVGATWGLIAVAGTVSSSAAHTTLRGLGKTESPNAVVFWFQAAVLTFSALVLTATGTWRIPPAWLVPHVIGVGLCATGGQLLMTRAYQADQAAVVSAATYSAPIWSVILDLLLFGTLPGPLAWIGGALILAAGWAILRPSVASAKEQEQQSGRSEHGGEDADGQVPSGDHDPSESVGQG